MGLRHAYTATGTNDAAKQVSIDRWNADHAITVGLNFPDNAVSPTPSPASGVDLYCEKPFQDWRLMGWEDPTGRIEYLCPHPLKTNAARLIAAGGATATTFAAAFNHGYTATANSFAVVAPSGSTALSRSLQYRLGSSGTAGNAVDHRGSGLLGNRTGGFFFTSIFRISTLSNTLSAFFGLMDNTTASANTDWTTSSTLSKIGLALKLAAGVGNWKLVHNPGATAVTATDLGASFPGNVTDTLRLSLFCKASDTTKVFWKVENLTTLAVTSGAISTNMPAVGTTLTPHQYISNGTNGVSVFFDSSGWLMQTDTV